MIAAKWERIKDLFEAALDHSEQERHSFLARLETEDPEVAGELIKLLRSYEDAGDFLVHPCTLASDFLEDLEVEQHRFRPDDVLCGRFRIVHLIGQGGMGEVYKAWDQELEDYVALKTLRLEISAHELFTSRFRREIQLARKVTHPNVCRIFDSFKHPTGDGYISVLSMELLQGQNLAEYLKARGRLTVSEALPIARQIISGLSAIHAAGILHRDLKPANLVMVPGSGARQGTATKSPEDNNSGPAGGAFQVKITDFGIAGQIPEGLSTTAQSEASKLLGTPDYMAPEQLELGKASVQSDIYAAGLILYEMVTGKKAFSDGSAWTRLTADPPPPRKLAPGLPENWNKTIVCCLERNPEYRFADAGPVLESLEAKDSSPAIPRKPLRVRLKRIARSKMAIATFLILVVALAAGIYRYFHQSAEIAKLGSGATVLLTGIQNSTGDKRFDGTTELLRHQLLQSPYFNLMDPSRIKESLEEMRQPANLPPSPATARGVALRNGAPRIIFGTVSRVGGRYVLDIKIEWPDNDTRRARAQWENHWAWNALPESPEKEIPSGFLNAIRDSGDWIRTQVGESVNDVARIDAPPQNITTDNWTALSEFVNAEKFKADGQVDNAVSALHNAIAADPHFALAYTRLGDVLVSLGQLDEGYAAYHSALAQEQQQRLTRREKDFLVGIYASDTEDFKTAESAFLDYTAYYPNDYLGWFYRAYPLMMTGHPEEAIATLERAAAIDPQKMFAPAHIARFDLIIGNFRDASKWIQHLRDTGHPDDADLVQGESDFLQGQYDEALNRFVKLQQSPDPHNRSYSFSLEARVYAELGQYRNALDALQRGIKEDVRTGDAAQQASKLLDRAYVNLKLENYETCLENVREALNLQKNLQNWLTAATLLGQAAAKTQPPLQYQLTREMRDIETQTLQQELSPFSDIVRAHVRGETLLAEGAWRQAVDEFRKTAQLEAPAKDKGYLARALIAAAQQTSDQIMAARLRKEALTTYRHTTSRPGQVWQWALGYPPGYLSDEVLSCIQSAYDGVIVDDEAKAQLKDYIRRRSRADLGLRDVAEAKRLASSAMFNAVSKTN